MKAYCWRNGVIGFAAAGAVPDGAIAFAEGPARRLRKVVSGTARLAYDGETLLVPGVPEAETDDGAVDALLAWGAWAGTRSGVTFYATGGAA